MKEMIVQEACKRRGSLQYRGPPVHIYKDYTPEVLKQLAKYFDTMSTLYSLRLFLLFPADYAGKRSQKEVGLANCQERPDVEAD